MKIVWGRSIGWNIKFQKLHKHRPTIAPPDGYEWTTEKNMEYKIIHDGADCYPWREVYAWLPVKTINGEYVWREKILKRKVWVVWGNGFHMEPQVQYATMFDRITIDDDKPFKN